MTARPWLSIAIGAAVAGGLLAFLTLRQPPTTTAPEPAQPVATKVADVRPAPFADRDRAADQAIDTPVAASPAGTPAEAPPVDARSEPRPEPTPANCAPITESRSDPPPESLHFVHCPSQNAPRRACTQGC